MFPPPKKKMPFGKPGMPAGKPPMDDLESPDPVEGKPPMPKAMPDMEAGDEGSGDYGAKLMADIESAGKAMGMDAATSRTAAGAFFKAAADCLGGGGDEGADQPDGGGLPDDDTGY